MEGPEIQYSEAVIDNGRFGKRVIRFETGRLAAQAAGSAMVYIDEDTALLSATSAGKSPREGFDFFPLTVDVEERMYAAGRIPGSFFRREGRGMRSAFTTSVGTGSASRPHSSTSRLPAPRRASSSRSRSISSCAEEPFNASMRPPSWIRGSDHLASFASGATARDVTTSAPPAS